MVFGDEALDLLLVTEDHATLPVRRDRAQVDDLYVSDRVGHDGGLGGGEIGHNGSFWLGEPFYPS